MNALAPSATSFTVTKATPLSACFSYAGTRHYYIVRVSDGQYKGSPYAVAYLKDGVFKMESGWFHTEKSARREFKAEGKEFAYGLFGETPSETVLTY